MMPYLASWGLKVVVAVGVVQLSDFIKNHLCSKDKGMSYYWFGTTWGCV